MDNLYEIEYQLTQKDLVAYRECFFAKSNKLTYALFFILAYLNIVFWGLNMISESTTFKMYWVNIIAIIVLAIFWVLGHLPSITYFFKRFVGKKSQDVFTKITFANDNITGVSNGKTSSFCYDTIKKTIFTKKYSFLVFNNDEVMIIPNKAFETGRFNSFKDFLLTKTGYEQKSADEIKRIKNTRIIACVLLIIFPILYYAVFVLIPNSIL